jgi:hypothetical protein
MTYTCKLRYTECSEYYDCSLRLGPRQNCKTLPEKYLQQYGSSSRAASEQSLRPWVQAQELLNNNNNDNNKNRVTQT